MMSMDAIENELFRKILSL